MQPFTEASPATSRSRVAQTVSGARLTPHVVEDADFEPIVAGAQLVIAAGASGVELLSQEARQASTALRVVIDLNAVPPAGIGGVAPQDKGVEHGGQVCYGAFGVGGLKMKLHKEAISRLFHTNDLVLDADAIYALGKSLELVPK